LWFNGRDHLVHPEPPTDELGPRQGDDLARDIVRLGQRWNGAFRGGAAMVPDAGPLREIPLPGLTVTLLSPGRPQLAVLLMKWPEVVAAARPDHPADVLGGEEPDERPLATLAGLPFTADTSEANGSSIAMLLRHEDGARVLLAADAHADVLVAGLRRIEPDGPVPVDLCTLPHHGSARNVGPALLDALSCRNWLVSSSGSRHADSRRIGLARVLARRGDPTLWFNYRAGSTAEFGRPNVMGRWGNRAEYPDDAGPGIRLEVAAGSVRRAVSGPGV
jgi:hypothetical protein